MDIELGRKWVDALRSGKYQQGFGALKTKAGGYCCLGVLCDAVLTPRGMVSRDDWEDRVDLSGVYHRKLRKHDEASIRFVPPSICPRKLKRS